MEALTERIVAAVESVVRLLKPHGVVPLHAPFTTADDAIMVAECAAHDPVGYTFIDLFERELEKLTGAAYAIALSSGTAALHLALLATGVKPGDVVGVPSLTFAATAAAICHAGATPHFGYALGGWVIEVDLLGEPAERFVYPWDYRDTIVIEDAAEALGSHYGAPLGSFGKVGVLSFNNNKIVTTGGGGAVLTNDPDIADRVRSLATTARDPNRPQFFEHVAIGYNYRMPNICAALGLGQLQRLETILNYKRGVRAAYSTAFKDADLKPAYFNFGKLHSNAWLNELIVPHHIRDEVLGALTRAHIMARPMFSPLHTQEPYKGFPVTEDEARRSMERFGGSILLPSGMMK